MTSILRNKIITYWPIILVTKILNKAMEKSEKETVTSHLTTIASSMKILTN